jgi:molybdopterin converting factor small subunit
LKKEEIKEVSLMDEETIDELQQEIKKDVGKWEEALLKWAYKVGRQVAVVLLEEMDDELMGGSGGGG